MVGAGEKSGTLATMFMQLEKYYTDLHQAQQKLKRNLVYPMMVIAALILLKELVVPIGNAYVSKMGIPIIDITLSFIFYLVCLSCAFGFYILMFRILFTFVSKETIFSYLWPFAIPVRKMLMARFCSAMALLCKTGIKFPEALVIASRVCGSSLIVEDAKRMAKRVRAGETLSEVMPTSSFFPKEHCASISMGEEGGTVDQAFARVAKMLHDEVFYIANLFTTGIVGIIILLFLFNASSFGKAYIAAMLRLLLPL